jgi:glycine oxidase
VRGQMVLLSQVPRLVSHVLQLGPRYLVPRSDGRILIGATEERVGFLKSNTALAVSDLIAFGTSLVPALADARFERAWSGLRPGSASGLPYLGQVGRYENLFIAAGHFRSGLQMSPGTGRLLRQSLLEQETEFPLEPFSCHRASGAATLVSGGGTHNSKR